MSPAPAEASTNTSSGHVPGPRLRPFCFSSRATTASMLLCATSLGFRPSGLCVGQRESVQARAAGAVLDCGSICPQTILESQNHRTSVLAETLCTHLRQSSLFYTWGNRGPEWGSVLPKVTWSVSNRGRTLASQATAFPSPSLCLLDVSHTMTALPNSPVPHPTHRAQAVICSQWVFKEYLWRIHEKSGQA